MSQDVVLVGLHTKERDRYAARESLDELRTLARAAGGEIVHEVLQGRITADPGTYIGRGKVEELADLCDRRDVAVVIFDDPLRPAQLRHLENEIGCLVVDRTQLILDIFATRAHSSEGQYQVELAQLVYLLPRLTGRGVDLSRLGAGIGTRGPGETKLEVDRRRIRQRIGKIRRELKAVEKNRAQQSRRRRESNLPEISLVGYTNAGKSTLFRALSGEDVLVSSEPFATLDPLVRRIELADGREALLSDTVGFIRKLPHTLVAAFKATLDQVGEADLLLNVVDASREEPEQQLAAVEEVLGEIEARSVPRIDVLNKVDRMERPERARAMSSRFENAVVVSALEGDGLDELRRRVVEVVGQSRRTALFRVPQSDGDVINELYDHGHVLSRSYDGPAVVLRAEVARSTLMRHRKYVIGEGEAARA